MGGGETFQEAHSENARGQGKRKGKSRSCGKGGASQLPTSSPQYDPAPLVRNQIVQISRGLVVFNLPSEMTVGTSEKITVRIARYLGEDEVKSSLQGRGAPQLEGIEVGTFMRARLFGDGFEITSHSDELQTFTDKHAAEWLYEVLPLESGKKTVYLSIAIRYTLPNSDETTNYPVLSREIAVQGNRW